MTPSLVPSVTLTNNDYIFFEQVSQVDLQLAVDANRDGTVSFGSDDQTTAASPYRFWVNDNHDGYADIGNFPTTSSSDSVQEDLGSENGNDATSNTISCTRDLEDYARIWLNVQGITNELCNGTLLLALQWENASNSPAVRIFPAVETNGGTLYLTDTNVAQSQITAPFGTNIVDMSGQQTVTTSAPFFFSTNYCTNFVANPTDCLLLDGTSAGSGQLVLAVYKNDGVTQLAQGPPLYISLNEITNMYERWTVGDGNGTPPSTSATTLSASPYSSGSPETGQYILFVHGWNMSPEAKDEFANTAYKRLWWQGYHGRFGAFRWPTLYGFGSWSTATLNLRNYDESESNAWASATGLESLLSSLNSEYPNSVYLMAHSMGNVVAGEALRLAGTNQIVNTYIGCQAAVSAHGYDPSTTEWQSSGGSPDCYAYYPTNGFPCYFSSVTNSEKCINFYNTNDWALSLWITNQSSKPDQDFPYYPGYYYETPSDSDPSGFYKMVGALTPAVNLSFSTNNYEIFAFGVRSYSYALGATANVNGWSPQSLPSLWGYDPYETEAGQLFKDHPWHSAEFLFTTAEQWQFWNTLMTKFGLPTSP